MSLEACPNQLVLPLLPFSFFLSSLFFRAYHVSMNNLKVCLWQTKPLSARKKRSRAQALTEYATLIAFVSILCALAFSFTSGKIGPAVSEAFHTTARQLDGLSSAATNAS